MALLLISNLPQAVEENQELLTQVVVVGVGIIQVAVLLREVTEVRELS
jgi:uncharacterized protein YoaH (UPF0181 family)